MFPGSLHVNPTVPPARAGNGEAGNVVAGNVVAEVRVKSWPSVRAMGELLSMAVYSSIIDQACDWGGSTDPTTPRPMAL